MTNRSTRPVGLAAVVVAAGVAAGAPLGASAQEQDRSDWPQSLKVGTASQGGTYFIYGAGWAGLVQEMLGVNTSTEATGGPVQNFALVNAGQLDLAMTTMGPAYEAWTGNSPIAPGVEMKDVRATFPMYQTPFQIIALANSGIDSTASTTSRARVWAWGPPAAPAAPTSRASSRRWVSTSRRSTVAPATSGGSCRMG